MTTFVIKRLAAVYLFLAITLFAWAKDAQAEENRVSLVFLPARYAFVSGDQEKFRAHHWMKDGYTGGVKDFSSRLFFGNGTNLFAEGHALIDQNDWGADVKLEKPGLGFLSFDFTEFRKYYDGTGGTYYRFTRFQNVDTGKELRLDVGKLGFQGALLLENLPELTFLYEREFKYGAKSRLTWTAVKEGGVTRNIGPSWQDVDEKVDVFAVGAKHELAGFQLSGEQRWEFVRSELLREERNFSTTTTASDQKIRRQDQAPETDLMTTTLKAERSFLEDKVGFFTAYRFAHMDNREFETIIETNAAGVPTNFSNPKQIRDARADNDYDSHVWTGNFTWGMAPWLNWGARLKAETVKRESNSSYPADASPNSAGGSTPNGVIDQLVVSQNDNSVLRWGEALSARFTGLPRTSLYAELESEQARVVLREDRKDLLGANAGETFSRHTITDVNRVSGTLGGRISPASFLDLTTHLRRRVNNNDYDDLRETESTGSTARSAFVDGQRITTNEAMVRIAVKPCRWFRPSFRYQLRDDDFATRVENEPIVKTGMLSHIYTVDLFFHLIRDWSATASYSRQNSSVTTPARLARGGSYIPPFNADVNTAMLTMDYVPSTRWVANGSFLYSWTGNFNDFTEFGLPLGVDDRRLDWRAGLTWLPKRDLSLKAEYDYLRYRTNSNANSGDYEAHIVWLEAAKKF